MQKLKIIKLLLAISIMSFASLSYADDEDMGDNDGLGQTIQIYTHFRSFIGQPSWVLIIRDLDHNQVIPYIYDVYKGNNAWLAFTYGRNYEITSSRLQFDPYRDKLSNFCGLQHRIYNAQSLYITVSGDLTPYRRTSTCHVSNYLDSNFSIVDTSSASE